MDTLPAPACASSTTGRRGVLDQRFVGDIGGAVRARPAMQTAPARIILLLVVGIASGFLLTEIAVRWLNPRPPTQVVRLLEQPQPYRPSLRHGEPVWKASADREHTRCAELHPDRTRIFVFGDSITYGINIDPDQVFSAILETALNQSRPDPGFCVMNFAQPGFGFDQSYAVASDEIARWKPALVLWENWSDLRKYVLVRDTAYLVNPPYVSPSERLLVRPDGSFGFDFVPAAPNRWLFDHSRLYEMLVLRWGQREPAPPSWSLGARYDHLKTLVDANGAKLVIFVATALDRPFETLARQSPASDVVRFASQRAVPLYRLAEELKGENYLALRMDAVGHFSVAGHAALAKRFEQIVLRELPAADAR